MVTRKKNDEEFEGEIVNELVPADKVDNTEVDMLYGNASFEDIISRADVDILPGWSLIEHKDELVGVSMAVVRATFRPSDIEGTPEYVSVYAVAKGLGNIVFNDGSTGIRNQVLEYLTMKGIAKPLTGDANGRSTIESFDWEPPADAHYVSASGKHSGELTVDVVFPKPVVALHGLRVSEYDYVGEDGKKTPAKTYYLG